MPSEASHRLHLSYRSRTAQHEYAARLWFCNFTRLKALFQFSDDIQGSEERWGFSELCAVIGGEVSLHMMYGLFYL